MYTFKKIKKKSRSDTWLSLFSIVNDLHGVNKKISNWTKLTKIGIYLQKKIMTNLTKLDKIWDKKVFNQIFINGFSPLW